MELPQYPEPHFAQPPPIGHWADDKATHPMVPEVGQKKVRRGNCRRLTPADITIQYPTCKGPTSISSRLGKFLISLIINIWHSNSCRINSTRQYLYFPALTFSRKFCQNVKSVKPKDWFDRFQLWKSKQRIAHEIGGGKDRWISHFWWWRGYHHGLWECFLACRFRYPGQRKWKRWQDSNPWAVRRVRVDTDDGASVRWEIFCRLAEERSKLSVLWETNGLVFQASRCMSYSVTHQLFSEG